MAQSEDMQRAIHVWSVLGVARLKFPFKDGPKDQMLLWEQVLLLTYKADHVFIERLMKEFFMHLGNYKPRAIPTLADLAP